jgi:hypothetical protein
VNTIDPRVAHAPLSRRARFDVAMLVTAGVASTALFLVPVWTSLSHAMVSPGPDVAPLASTRTALDSPLATASVRAAVDAPASIPTPRRRPVTRIARVEPAPTFMPERPDTKKPQSRLSRFLLGDGSESVQPFPLADRRSER